jgi:hypothetical protein
MRHALLRALALLTLLPAAACHPDGEPPARSAFQQFGHIFGLVRIDDIELSCGQVDGILAVHPAA